MNKHLKIILIALTLALAVGVFGPHKALAETSGDFWLQTHPMNITGSNINKMYLYVRAGETVKAEFTKEAFYDMTKPLSHAKAKITNPEGWTQTIDLSPTGNVGDVVTFTSVPTATVDGVWEIEFIDIENSGIWNGHHASVALSWDIGVYNQNVLIPGRLWLKSYRTFQGADNNVNPQDIELYYLEPNGYLYKQNINGYYGLYSTFFAGPKGIVDGQCRQIYKSVNFYDQNGWIQSDIYDSIFRCQDYFKLFFADPRGANLPDQVTLMDGTVTSLKLTVEPTTISNLKLNPINPKVGLAGEIIAQINNYVGNVTLEIDANGDGDYSDSVDRTIGPLQSDQNFSYNFDGKDGLGQLIKYNQKVNFRIRADKKGEFHFIRDDAEKNLSVSIERLNGSAAGRSLIYYNDSDLNTSRCGTYNINPQDASINGIDSSSGVHGWDNDNCLWPDGSPGGDGDGKKEDPLAASYGDGRYIQDWAYDENSAYTSGSYVYQYFDKTNPNMPKTGVGDNQNNQLFLTGLTISLAIVAWATYKKF